MFVARITNPGIHMKPTTPYRRLLATALTPILGTAIFTIGGAAAPAEAARSTPGSIVGSTDDRTRVTPTGPIAGAATVMIQGNAPNGTLVQCSGVMYGPSAVATAGHCVYTFDNGVGWLTNVRVWPGIDGTQLPYGSCAYAALNSNSFWTVNHDINYDYGNIKLVSSCTIGSNTGTFGLRGKDGGSYDGQSVNVQGYPVTVPFGGPNFSQWRASGSVSRTETNTLGYDADMTSGESGSAVWSSFSDCSAPCSYAINTYDAVPVSYPVNRGNRITLNVYNFLQAHK